MSPVPVHDGINKRYIRYRYTSGAAGRTKFSRWKYIRCKHFVSGPLTRTQSFTCTCYVNDVQRDSTLVVRKVSGNAIGNARKFVQRRTSKPRLTGLKSKWRQPSSRARPGVVKGGRRKKARKKGNVGWIACHRGSCPLSCINGRSIASLQLVHPRPLEARLLQEPTTWSSVSRAHRYVNLAGRRGIFGEIGN